MLASGLTTMTSPDGWVYCDCLVIGEKTVSQLNHSSEEPEESHTQGIASGGWSRASHPHFSSSFSSSQSPCFPVTPAPDSFTSCLSSASDFTEFTAALPLPLKCHLHVMPLLKPPDHPCALHRCDSCHLWNATTYPASGLALIMQQVNHHKKSTKWVLSPPYTWGD